MIDDERCSMTEVDMEGNRQRCAKKAGHADAHLDEWSAALIAERDELAGIVRDLAQLEPRASEPGECGLCAAGFSAPHGPGCPYAKAAAWAQSHPLQFHVTGYDIAPPRDPSVAYLFKNHTDEKKP